VIIVQAVAQDALQAPVCVTIGENCARKMRTFVDLAEKLKMSVEDLMRQSNGKVSKERYQLV
jgi:hypothetical protein